MIYDEVALWGLKESSSQEEIWDVIFKRLQEQGGRVSIATVKDGKPESRIISLQRMSDGDIYLMTSRGKPFYRQLKENPWISASSLLEDTHHSIRIRACAEECVKESVYREYAEKNPGTMKMYRHNTALIVLFRLSKGSGEIFHLYRDDMVRRLCFSFGGEKPVKLSYSITDQCTGCGKCAENCAEQSIYRGEDGKYHIKESECDDCGICYTKCPLTGAAMINRLEEDC